MPNMADITVKKNDTTTDITYTKMIPSAGDKSPAVWRSTTVGTAPAHNPQLVATSRPNGTGSARRVDAEYTYPSLVTGSDGKTNISDKVVINMSAVIPQGMPTADSNEAASQAMNLFASTLFKDTLKAGFAPT